MQTSSRIRSSTAWILGSLYSALLSTILHASTLNEQEKLEREVAREENLAVSDVQRLQNLLNKELARSNEERKEGLSREFLRGVAPSVKSKLNLSDLSIPLHKRFVEKQRQDTIDAFHLLDSFYRRYAQCDPIPPSFDIWERPEEQAAILTAASCFRGEVEHFFSEMRLAWDAQRQRLRQLHLPSHSERLRIYLCKEEEERRTAEWHAQFDPRLKYWQSMEDVLVYFKAHPIQHTPSGLRFATQEELVEFRRLIGVMNTALKNQEQVDSRPVR